MFRLPQENNWVVYLSPFVPSPFHGSTSLTVLSLPKDGEGEISG